MVELAKPRLVSFNHVALEVGNIEEALAFYGRLFTFELCGKSGSMAFIDLGDQFIALQQGRKQPADDGRHFGLVIDDKEAGVRVEDLDPVSTRAVAEYLSVLVDAAFANHSDGAEGDLADRSGARYKAAAKTAAVYVYSR
jgi:catechol 2,3-dioxygenase-like lactoylglutathione lyase family enzyme